MSDPRYYCAVCNWKFQSWKEPGDICPCCGAEHGVDDDWHYRTAWMKAGAPWAIPEYKPDNWSLKDQLRARGKK